MDSQNLTYVGNGNASLVFRTQENFALNVFYNKTFEEVSRIFDRLSFAHDRGIKVPKPKKLTKRTLTERDLKGIGFFGKLEVWKYQKRDMPIVGGELPVIEREFIEGIPLNRFILPRLKLRKKVRRNLKDLKSNGLSLWELCSDSFLLTSRGEVFLVDFEPLYFKGKEIHPKKYLIDRLKFVLPPICRPDDMFYSVSYLLTHSASIMG